MLFAFFVIEVRVYSTRNAILQEVKLSSKRKELKLVSGKLKLSMESSTQAEQAQDELKVKYDEALETIRALETALQEEQEEHKKKLQSIQKQHEEALEMVQFQAEDKHNILLSAKLKALENDVLTEAKHTAEYQATCTKRKEHKAAL